MAEPAVNRDEGFRISSTDSKGYPLTWQPEHPRARNKRYVLTHILVVERALGKRLRYGAEVHHVNEDRADFSNTNLVVCEDHAYHLLLHSRADAYRATGNARARRCVHCGAWVTPETPGTYWGQRKSQLSLLVYHHACALAYYHHRYGKGGRRRRRSDATS